MRIAKFAFITIIAIAIVTLNSTISRADSPLTSTDFALAYQDVELVKLASTKKLTPTLMKALSSPHIPDDIKAAIINALGWSIDGQNNSYLYLKYIAQSHDKKPSELTIAELTPQETFALGYLVAMDDYFDLKPIGGTGEVEQADAVKLVKAATAKAPNNFTVAFIASLVEAQRVFNNDWCAVYLTVANVKDNFSGTRNMRPEAITIVMGYIDLYQDNCTNQELKSSS